MRRLMLACVVAALATPAAQASPPIPDVGSIASLLDPNTVVQDYCVYERQTDDTSRKVACVPAGRIPNVEIDEPMN